MNRRTTIYALLLGNFVTGSAVLAPAGMLGEIARHFGIGVPVAGYLIAFGAVVLCISSPLMTWLTARMDRRLLLTGAIGLVACGHFAAALASTWEALLAIRLVTMAAAAIFTPQAASTIASLVTEEERPAAIATAFLGWSLALACGVPLVSMVAEHAGWQQAYLALGCLGLLGAATLWAAIPAGIAGSRLPLSSWQAILRSPSMRLILAVTVLTAAGQFLLFSYLKPIFAALTHSGANRVTSDLALFGLMSIVGNILASRFVTRIGMLAASLLSLAAIGAGMLGLFAGIDTPALVTLGLVVWGLGFAASNSMQQARLAHAAPTLTGASIALNTSSIYIGQAAGAGVGGLMVGRGWFLYSFPMAAALVGIAIAVALWSGRRGA